MFKAGRYEGVLCVISKKIKLKKLKKGIDKHNLLMYNNICVMKWRKLNIGKDVVQNMEKYSRG